MLDIILNIITLGLKPLYKKNISYFNLIAEFRKKLPRPQNEARKMSNTEKDSNPFFPESMKYFNTFDVTKHKPTITEQDLDFFINSIQNFDYSYMLFKSYYQSFSNNILRLKPTSDNGNLDLIVLQEVLKDDPLHPLKPIDVLMFHLKYKFNPSSKLYLKYFKK